jgi:O-antigen ligase
MTFTWKTTLENWAFRLFCLSLFFSAFSLPTGRAFLLISLIVLIINACRGRGRIRFPFSAWCWIAFVAIAILASAWGVNPARSFRKIDKLIWFMGIPIATTLATSRLRVLQMLRAYVYGAIVLSVDILGLRVFEAWQHYKEVLPGNANVDLWWEIIERGSMTHGQILSVALVALAGLIIIASRQYDDGHHHRVIQSLAIADRPPVRRITGWLMTLMMTAALIVNFKRGAWVATATIIACLLGLTERWRRLAFLGVAAIALTALPPVQSRLMSLRNEFTLGYGGRLVMWTKIAPELIREHPLGIGFRALDDALMQKTANKLDVRVERGRNHLHSNILQVTASTGWAGLFVYLLWMGRGLYQGLKHPLSQLRQRQRSKSKKNGITRQIGNPIDILLPLTLAMMLSALIVNGLVEYNLADGELVLIYGALLGLLEGGFSRGDTTRTSTA